MQNVELENHMDSIQDVTVSYSGSYLSEIAVTLREQVNQTCRGTHPIRCPPPSIYASRYVLVHLDSTSVSRVVIHRTVR